MFVIVTLKNSVVFTLKVVGSLLVVLASAALIGGQVGEAYDKATNPMHEVGLDRGMLMVHASEGPKVGVKYWVLVMRFGDVERVSHILVEDAFEGVTRTTQYRIPSHHARLFKDAEEGDSVRLPKHFDLWTRDYDVAEADASDLGLVKRGLPYALPSQAGQPFQVSYSGKFLFND